MPRISICNSFQLNNKAMSSTIRTLLAGDLSTISGPDDIASAVAQKLRGHFSLADDPPDEASVALEYDESSNPYDNYQLAASRAIPQKKTETAGVSLPGSERRAGRATFKKHSNPPLSRSQLDRELGAGNGS